MTDPEKSRTIKVDYLARVEGEGSLYVKMKGARVEEVQLKIFEPPRFFEAFLRGRKYTEAPDITARICGICPVAYQMSSVHAMENALGIRVDGPLRDLRRLLYCGEWIESHVLHAFMLHAPDFLGYPDAVRMAKDHRALVENVLRAKKAGNRIVALVGGREIHPINVKVGGFYKLPAPADLAGLLDELRWGRDFSLEALRFAAGLPFPDFEQDYHFVALRHPAEYPFNEGRIVSNRGLDLDARQYDDHFAEEHVAHSNALHSVIKGQGNYFVGPLARYNLNFDRLHPPVQEAARAAGLGPTCRNPFKSILVRCVETLQAFEEAIRIVNTYRPPSAPAVDAPPRTGTGYAATEAPRGILYHRYTLDDAGNILDAKIVPPTSQNQKTIENDLREFIPLFAELPQDELTHKCEQAIRNYDPCISCATHFLKLTLDRE
jgi:coenzyme F420-reducing hydrogenase alpha subunit